MKSLFYNALKSWPLRSILNPEFKRITKVKGGLVCLILSDRNMLGDLVIHNFITQQLQVHGYTVAYGMSESFFRKHAAFLKHHSLANNYFVLPSARRKWISFIFKLRKEGIKAVILDQYPLISSVFFYLGKVPLIIAPTTQVSPFATQYFVLDKSNSHYTDIARLLIKSFGTNPSCIKQHRHSVFFPHRKQRIEQVTQNGGVYLSIHAGGGNYWNRKWPLDRYIDLCRLFLENYKGKIFLIGGKDEISTNQMIMDNLTQYNATEERVISFCGVDLNTTANVIAASDLFIGNDSGPSHIANGLNKRMIAIFGPSEKNTVNPTDYNKRNVTVALNLDCMPCNTNCRLPDEYQYTCLSGISVAMVWEKLREVIKEGVV